MTQQLLPPAGLHDEIVEVYREGGERPAKELLAMLNTPSRIQRRGFPATTEHLLAIIIDTCRSSPNDSVGDNTMAKGKIDYGELDYEEIVELLSNLPMTWYPALLGIMVAEAYDHNVFQPGGASRIVRKIEAKIEKFKGEQVEEESEDEEEADSGGDE